ncbi:MAG: PorV/PorQ family protein [Elusimicrobia bacterium]|jgi:hypothetical protein|nr:PorV/PorQ family protein [Elusimicrobiota bacterium]
MKPLNLFMLLCVFAVASLHAKGRASVVGEFLTIPFGERAVGMGETGAALPEDASGLFWNPATLVRAPRTSLVIGRVPYAEGAAQNHFLVSRAVGAGVFGAGYGSFSHGTIEGSDLDGFPTNTLKPLDSQIALGYARYFPAVPFLAGHIWGVSGKYIYSRLENTAKTYTWDVGILSPAYWKNRLRWGASSVNNGGALQYNDDREALPRTTRVGAVWTPLNRWVAATDLVKGTDEPLAVSAGVEYGAPLTSSLTFFTRAGYTTTHESLDGLRLGFGLGMKNLRVDYSFRFNENETATHGLGLTLEWDERKKGLPPALQAKIDRGNKLVETGQYPEAVLTFHDAIKTDSRCQEARDGLERAYRLMQGR